MNSNLFKFYYGLDQNIELLYSDYEELVFYSRWMLSRKILEYVYELDSDRLYASQTLSPDEANIICEEKTALIDEYVDLLDSIYLPDWFDEELVSEETRLLYGAILNDYVQYTDLKVEDIF